MSGNLKPSQFINYTSTRGVGTVIAGGWFVVDNTYGIYNYFKRDDFKTLSDEIDDTVANKRGRVELYDGIY